MAATEYREGTTHHCLVRIHHGFYTIVHVDGMHRRQCSICDQERPDSAHVLFEVVSTEHGLVVSGAACCPESAFREAWNDIAQLESQHQT